MSSSPSAAPITKAAYSVVTSFPSIPLTTTFTPADDCAGIYRSEFVTVVHMSKSCRPSGFKANINSYFSPGYICPSGYESACHDNTGVASVTTVTCCPTISGDISLSCVNPRYAHDIWSTIFCTWIAPPGTGTVLPMTVSEDGPTSTSMAGFASPGGLNALGIRMVYESSDVIRAPATNPTDSSETSGVAKPTQDASEPSGLSTGAQAAIGVVVPVVVLGLLAGLFFWWRRRQRNRGAALPQGDPDVKSGPIEVSDNPIHELPAQPAVELPAMELPREIADGTNPSHGSRTANV